MPHRSIVALTLVSLALFAPQGAASPVGECVTFVTGHSGLLGPQVTLDSQITVLFGTSSSATGTVAGVIIDPVACGSGADPLANTVNQASAGQSAPDHPSVPLLP